MICEGLLPSHIRPIRPALVRQLSSSPSSDNSPADTHTPQEFTIASCLTVYHRAKQPRVKLDLEITAGSYNAKVNLLGVLQLNFN